MARLIDRTGSTGEASPGDMDRIICSYIEKYQMEYYDELTGDDDRFPVFYNLSVLRTGLLNWYNFRADASLLEIGAGFGALTGMLCERCRYVAATERSKYRAQAIQKRFWEKDNLDIYVGDWSGIDFGRQFDYIVLNGILERAGRGSREKRIYAELLQGVSGLLKPDGVLLFSVENRYGIRYFCGVDEPHTHRPFDGINHYPYGTGGYSFSRQELIDIVELAGFTYHKLYYPLPDYKLPQLIYTDGYLPEKNLKERLIPYYVNQRHLIAVEADLYNDIAENHVFPFFANSFLMECPKDGRTGEITYAAISTDRGMERSFATTITSSHTVQKKPLSVLGRDNAVCLFKNIEDLRAHGIPVIQQHWEDGAIRMPFIEWPTLSNCLKELMPRDTVRFQEILDELYGFILQSSEETEPGRNELRERALAAAKDGEEKNKTAALEWGPVLKKAYMELIPLNCFYEEKERQYLFFDQEFVREDYPAKYVLFRAIHYVYCFTPGAESCLPQKVLREKYGMEDTWEYYQEEERRFLDEVRNREVYRQFYRWSRVDRKEIYANIRKLDSEEERISSYTVSDKMKKIWKAELGILEQVQAVCEAHDIKYFLLHGTLLGAVRHKGFIPWDDDLDIGMLREDYDRFVSLAAGELRPPCVLQNMFTEKDIFFGSFTRVRNSDTTAIQARELGHKGNQGIWIDILPLDICTLDEKKKNKKVKKIKNCYRLLQAKIYGKEERRIADLNPLQSRVCRFFSVLCSHKALCERLDRAIRLYTEEESDQVAVFGFGSPRALNRADFIDTVQLDFAGKRLPAPAGYKNYLSAIMGRDYMKYPPEEERKPKHKGIFDPERPYTEYVKKLTGMFDDIKGKKIILFGAGLMFDDYMKKWGNRYHPAFTVDNDENKWGRSRQGVEIREPKAILEVPPEKRRLIICSFYYKEIQKQLQEMGVQDYQIYVQRLEWVLQAEKNEKT